MSVNLIDNDVRFVIDEITKTISLKEADAETPILVQGDHNSELITIEVPISIEGHSIFETTAEIHYLNMATNNIDVNKGVYQAEEIALADDQTTAEFCWLISSQATKYAGTLEFSVHFYTTDEDGNRVYVWNTTPYSAIEVKAGIDNGNAVIESSVDVFNEWYNRLVESILISNITYNKSQVDGGINTLAITTDKGEQLNFAIQNGTRGVTVSSEEPAGDNKASVWINPIGTAEHDWAISTTEPEKDTTLDYDNRPTVWINPSAGTEWELLGERAIVAEETTGITGSLRIYGKKTGDIRSLRLECNSYNIKSGTELIDLPDDYSLTYSVSSSGFTLSAPVYLGGPCNFLMTKEGKLSVSTTGDVNCLYWPIQLTYTI